jgi:hypothetical protein
MYYLTTLKLGRPVTFGFDTASSLFVSVATVGAADNTGAADKTGAVTSG